ncbi:MAG: fumarylacetoacetate hydrolase family protein [Bowdeniella nasicola]|nr:fumarylacetoacetate hydrolase family protein [Bowdeniella nasicola]
MKIARFSHDDDISYGVLDGDELVLLQSDPLFAGFKPLNRRIPVEEVRLLSPVIPRSKVVGIGRNYRAHAAELGNDVPSEPVMFFKPNTAVIGPDDPIVLPPWDDEIHHEAELAVVISRPCKDVPLERAREVIFGYTAANDVSARTAQRGDSTWARAKGFDTSCPLGPYLVIPGDDDFDPANARIRCAVDGELRQDGTTADMIFSIAEQIAYVSSVCSLLPGDVILTGTPAGVGPIQPGQRVEVDVEGIGVLANPVVRR